MAVSPGRGGRDVTMVGAVIAAVHVDAEKIRADRA
jgi:hypothetical protein